MNQTNSNPIFKTISCAIFLCIININCSKKENYLPNFSVAPIIFHIAHNGEPLGVGTNISEIEISRQLEKINYAFRFMQIQFKLAKYSPDGAMLKEPGIDRVKRIENSYTFYQAWNYAIDLFWNPKEYLNVLLIDAENYDGGRGIAGQGRLPQTVSKDPLPGLSISYSSDNSVGFADGIIVDSYFFTQHFIVVHELGHFFGLSHTFNEECDGFDADYCYDTPTYSRSAYELDPDYKILGARRLSCEGVPFISKNYMDYYYSYDSEFTKDQKDRMNDVINRSPRRKELFSSDQIKLILKKDSNNETVLEKIPEILN